jgi:muconate cycloisomerase
MKLGDVKVILADIPVRRPHTMSFTTLETVNFVFVRLETTDGLTGWGEAACLGGPTWSEESAESVAVTIERYVAPWLVGRDASHVEPLAQEMARRIQGNPFARAAVEMALWDLNGRALGVPVHRMLGGRVRDRVPLSWSLAVSSAGAHPAGTDARADARMGREADARTAAPEAEIEEVHERLALGHRIFKIKTAAHSVADDVERVRRIRDAVGPTVSLRVDANQGWDRPTALRAIRALEPYDVDFVEQPVPRWDVGGLCEIGRQVRVPIMADESCFSPHDALDLVRRGGVSILSLKLTKSAGILGAMAVSRIAEAAGMGGYVGCMIETSLGTAAYLQVALAATPVTWGCELFGPLLLVGDVVREPVRYADGHVLALDGPGLGVDVDEARLEEWIRH